MNCKRCELNINQAARYWTGGSQWNPNPLHILTSAEYWPKQLEETVREISYWAHKIRIACSKSALLLKIGPALKNWIIDWSLFGFVLPSSFAQLHSLMHWNVHIYHYHCWRLISSVCDRMTLKSLHHFFMFSFLRGQRLWGQREENQVKGQGQEERTGLDVPDKWGKGLKKQEERYDSAVHGLLCPPQLNLHFSSLHCFVYLDACWWWLSKITFSQQSLPLLPKLQPNQTVMTVKRRPNQPNQRRSPQPAQRPCSKQQGTRTKTRRRRKKAGLPGTVFSF